MKKAKSALTLCLMVVLTALHSASQSQAQASVPRQAKPEAPAQQEKAELKAPRPIELPDILAWKTISAAAISDDGQWFAWRMTPVEGDSEVIVRKTKDAKADRFPVGETPRFGSGSDLAFSDDSKWLTFLIYPEAKEAKKLRKDKKPVQTKAALIKLATGEKTEYEKIKGYAFSGESAKWLALHRYPPESQEKEKEKWLGSDLILRELATGQEINIGNVSEFAFDKKGLWLAWLIDAQGQSGNGIQIRNLTSGSVSSLDSDKSVYKSLNWTEKGDALAALKGKEDKDYEDKLYGVVGFSDFAAKSPLKAVYDPKDDKTFPEGMTISLNRRPAWTEDLTGIVFGIHELKKKESKEKKEDDPAKEKEKAEARPSPPEKPKEEVDEADLPDLVLWHWQDKRLQSQQQVEENRDKNFSYLSVYRIKEKTFIRLADEKLRQVEAAPKDRWAIGLDNSEYQLASSLDGRRYQDIYVIDLITGERRKAKKAEIFLYTRETYKDYPEFYVADGALQNGQKITETNPQQKDFLWSSGSMLVDYQSAKGAKLQAALFLPANYEKGKSYPAVVYIYEKLSQGLNRYYAPSANGFNKSVYTSRGYAVLMPDITYQINDPGMSAVWCVLPALEAAIATGVVDRARVGIQGHSWGGYQTAFLVTQTEAFAAAVAGAPLTNMISMYSSVYWNSGSANQPIFESSQGRFTGGYWENLDAYARNSPVYFAEKVKTPLVILHNDKDGAVDWNQGIEYFNTLRRLHKPVVMLEYVGENHGLRKPANQKDYTLRMGEFFDHYLMGKPAPQWLIEGVSHLKLKDHLKERVKAMKPAESEVAEKK